MAAVVVTRHGLQGPRQAQDTVNVRINVDGRAHLFGGRVGARRRGEYPGQQRRLFIFDRHERVAAEQQYVAKLKCLCKVGLGSVGVDATPAAEATASPGRAIVRSGWPGWQALQSVGDQDLTKLVVSACRSWHPGSDSGTGYGVRRPSCKAVATSAPAAPADSSARRAAWSRTPPPPQLATSGRPAASSAAASSGGPEPVPARSRSITSSSPTPSTRARGAAAAGRDSAKSGEISRPSCRSTLSTNGGADMANKGPGSAPGPIHCVPTTLRATPTRASAAAL